MWLPATCVYGPLAGDIAANPAPDGEPDLHAELAEGQPRGDGHVTPTSVAYATAHPSATVTINDVPTDRTWAVVRFTFGDTQYVDYMVTFPMTTADN